MKASAAAPAPDPKIGEAALLQAQTGEKWMSFAKDSFAVTQTRQAELDALTKKVGEQQLGIADEQAGWARGDRDRYEKTFKPIEDKFIAEASNYDTPEKQAEAAATARADIATAAAGAKAANLRDAAGLGIAPGSGRFTGISTANDQNLALADAGAANNARSMVRDKGLALKADVANMGRGLPTQSAQAASLGLNAGNSVLAGRQSANAQQMAATDIMGTGFKGQMAGYAGQADTLSRQYGIQMDGWKAAQDMAAKNASGIGGFVGTIGASLLSDENVKENKKKIPDGKALKAVKEMPVESWDYKDGAGDGGSHIGTYAQDFKKATGTGDGKTISAIDAIGITMKAVQDLDKKVDALAKPTGIGAPKPAPANNNKTPSKKKEVA